MHPVEALLLPVGWLLRNRRPDEVASIANALELATGNRITLTSPAFRDGQVVPSKHCGQFIGDDISPALTWSALPTGTKGLVFVLEDLPRFEFLPNRRRQAKYSGPGPLPGYGTHRYRYHLYALDTDIDFTKVADVQAASRSSRHAAPWPRRSCSRND